MRFIDEHEIILREKIHQGRWRVAHLSIREVHRVVFDPIHESDFRKHLHIVFDAHFDTFCFDEFSDTLEMCHLRFHFFLDPREDFIDDGFTRDEVFGREYHHFFIFSECNVGEVFSFGNAFEGVSEKFEPIKLFTRAWPDFDRISEDMKHSGLKICC